MNGIGFLHNTMLGMTFEEIEQSVARNDLVLIPVGVVEEHGPHLPLGTDIYVSMSQAEKVLKNLREMDANAIIGPPFYFGGTMALTRQFAGTFTSRKEVITEAMYDYLCSLDRFGYKRCVMFNNHGDSLQKESLTDAIKKANTSLKLKSFWLEYEDDIEYDGFNKNDDFLAIMPPYSLDRFATVNTEITDECDFHAGAFETAMMLELYPEEVHTDKMVDLPPTNLSGEKITKWVNGEKEDKNVIPNGYCGDPMKAFDIKTHCEDLYEHMAKGLKDFFTM